MNRHHNQGVLLAGAVRHLVAASATVGVATLCGLLAYVALLLVAIIFDGGLGGPFAPVGLAVMSGAFAAISVAVVLFPLTAITEWLCGRRFGWGVFSEIPVSTVLLFPFVLLALGVGDVAFGYGFSALDFLRWGIVGTVVLAVPLGLYWWLLKAAQFFYSFAARLPTFFGWPA
ncbi:MAG: hypothetical protein K8J08_02810 [Thermoanaerobaculia bacterium]|nr:hypothetical protein [Thermoanaerobaculia bacterium]